MIVIYLEVIHMLSIRALNTTWSAHRAILFLLIYVSAHSVCVSAQTTSSAWTMKIKHMIGLTDISPQEDGVMTIGTTGVTFQGKQHTAAIASSSLIAASSDTERVELWGTKGQILRSVIPDGGGILLAAFAHHRVGMLTIEYRKADGGRHAAVFLVPEEEMHNALGSFPQPASLEPAEATGDCSMGHVDQQAVQVLEPDWNTSDVPVAYRVLLYENLISRLERQNGLKHVYRYGQRISNEGCPRYTIRLAASTFTAGNQVQRAAMGPAGMFVGATKISMNATVSDEMTRKEFNESIKTAIRGQSESFGAPAKEAKKIAGKFAKMKKDFEKQSVDLTGKLGK
jgi:hypothetical protein